MTGEKIKKVTGVSADPPPSPSPAPIEEMIMAKDKTKSQAKKKGRSSTILAGRMMQNTLNFGKSRVGE